MTIVRYEPWRLVNRFHRDFGRFFGESVDEAAGSGALSWLQPVDVREEESRFVVQVDLPGVDKKDIEITAEKGVLTIKGERSERGLTAGTGTKAVQLRSVSRPSNSGRPSNEKPPLNLRRSPVTIGLVFKPRKNPACHALCFLSSLPL